MALIKKDFTIIVTDIPLKIDENLSYFGKRFIKKLNQKRIMTLNKKWQTFVLGEISRHYPFVYLPEYKAYVLMEEFYKKYYEDFI